MLVVVVADAGGNVLEVALSPSDSKHLICIVIRATQHSHGPTR